ncbi:hypothetical protein K7X08_030990 [Anisodus acutangulus]|uniref:Uncharacterized protein n=1 Tax=Anisodus acutangulus TaxID=402998 RepID=A0A9Q1RNF1_9SOLA|nr:hypothetical protein K7X08_030990 [Anisodus acutangulus]
MHTPLCEVVFLRRAFCDVTPTSPSSGSHDIPRVATRRSLRLASKTGLSEVRENLSYKGKSKYFEIDNGKSLTSAFGVKSAALDDDKGLGVLHSEEVGEIGQNESYAIGNVVEYVKEVKYEKRASMEVQGEEENKFLSLRSGKKISKGAVEGSTGHSVGKLGSIQNGYDEKLLLDILKQYGK